MPAAAIDQNPNHNNCDGGSMMFAIPTTMATNTSNANTGGVLLKTSLPPEILQERYEEDPGINIGHITVLHNGYVILLSGFKGYTENSTACYRPSNEIWVYDQIVEKWIKRICAAETCPEDIPLERSSACGTIINDHLYMFGGWSEKQGNLNSLYRLDLRTLKWRRMVPLEGREPLPCDKNVCWEHDEKFYLFGGYGPVPRVWSEDFTFQFIFDNSSHWHYVRGWNNQLVCYNETTNCWEWPQHSGDVPSARAACAASNIGDQVYLFGGRVNDERMNDLYVLDMQTFRWTRIQANDPEHPVRGRSWHTLTPLHDRLLVLYGGFSHDNQPLKDCWIFDTCTYTWRSIVLPFEKPRFWHSATLSPFGEILVLGGATEELTDRRVGVQSHPSRKSNHMFAKDMFAIRFQPQSLFRLCLGVISKNPILIERLFEMLPTSLQEIIFKRCLSTNNMIKLQNISMASTSVPSTNQTECDQAKVLRNRLFNDIEMNEMRD